MQTVLECGLLQSGLVAVQDEAAGLVVTLLDPRPEDTILDVCSAPGGKTIFAAQRMLERSLHTANADASETMQALSDQPTLVPAGSSASAKRCVEGAQEVQQPAAALQDIGGSIVAMDISAPRLQLVRKGAQAAGVRDMLTIRDGDLRRIASWRCACLLQCRYKPEGENKYTRAVRAPQCGV